MQILMIQPVQLQYDRRVRDERKGANDYQCNTSKGTFVSLTDTNHFTIHGYFICHAVKCFIS